jgi:hypothetical protein
MVVKFVVFVINLKPSNIFSLIVIMLVFSGVRFIGVFGIAPPTNVSHLFGDGRNWVTTNTIFFCFDRSIGPVLGNLAHKK